MVYSGTVRVLFGLLLPSLASCAYSLEGEIQSTRAEIVELQRRLPPETALWVHEGPDNFGQFIDDDTPRVPDFIYLHLLRRLHAMSAAEVEADAQGSFDGERFSKDPAAFRGRIYRIHGVVAELHTETVGEPKHPVRTVHAGLLFDRDRRPVLFHVVDKPDVLVLHEDTVETAAVFVKMIEYTSKSGRRVSAPFFVGKVLRRYL